MEQLSQRIRFRFHFHIAALDLTETESYIKHRLQLASSEKRTEQDDLSKIFSAECYPVIYKYTGRIPRLINTLCDTSMISAFVDGKKIITEDTLEAAIEELQWVPYYERAGVKAYMTSEMIPYVQDSVAYLVDINTGSQTKEYELNNEVTTIGRMKGNTIYIADDMVSMHHAKITRFHSSYFLEDLKSTNGTYVNSRKIKKCVLKNGDIISFARYAMKFVIVSSLFSEDEQLSKELIKAKAVNA